MMAVIAIALAMVLPIAAFAAESNKSQGVAMELHDMLKRDFGYDLPISGGFGKSGNPIVLTTHDPHDAALAMSMTLRGIGRGRNVFWKSLSRENLSGSESQIVQYKIETKEVTQSEVITQTENYFFDVGRVKPPPALLSEPIAYLDQRLGLSLPYGIGWFHYDSIIDNERTNAGLGKSIAYSAPESKMTLYIYDKGIKDIPDDLDSPIVVGEFKQAIGDFKSINADAEPWGDVMRSKAFLILAFKVGNNVSLVGLGVIRGSFFKIRVTNLQDPIYIQNASESLSALVDILTGK